MAKKKTKRFGNPAKNAEYQAREARLHGASLSEKDSSFFYELFTPLLIFTDKRLDVLKNAIEDIDGTKVVMDYDEALASISDELWKNPSLLDAYMEETTLSEEQKALLQSWKRYVQGKFAVVRHQKNGSVLVDIETEKVYRVKGIIDTLEDMLAGFPLPFVIQTTLLPFKDVIITSGHIGVAYEENAENAEKLYQQAKENGTIITVL